jgi:hypothetical protein
MSLKSFSLLFSVTAFAAFAAPAFADDCAAVRSAMMTGAKMPYTTTITKIDGQGRKTVSQVIQTATTKYVQTHGKWLSMNISEKDLLDNLKVTKITCVRIGMDSTNGQPAAIYKVHTENDGTVLDEKMWISAKGLPLKSEALVDGTTYESLYDLAHAQPPADAKPVGSR